MNDRVELVIHGAAVGGDGLARGADGRIVFVEGALPGETVLASVLDSTRQWVRARLDEVIVAADGRQAPPCPHIATGCGGCDLQHATSSTQAAVKTAILADVLRRQARLSEHPPIEFVDLPGEGYRTTVHASVERGRAGFHKRASADVVAPDSCLVAHPLVEELLVDGRFGDATQVTLRAGARTGERLALVSPTRDGVVLPPDVRVVGADELAAGRRSWYHEEAAGRTWRISAESFFQIRPDGAEALVELVSEMVAGIAPGSRLVDLYAGVGLFGATAGAGHIVTTVESSPSAVADARVNLAGSGARIVVSEVERWSPRPAEVVIADPSRDGLGAKAVETIHRTGAQRVVLVGCDPAAFGRDIGLLTAKGYRLERVVAVDLFAQTSHIEAVAELRR